MFHPRSDSGRLESEINAQLETFKNLIRNLVNKL